MVELELCVVHPVAAQLVSHVPDGHTLAGGHVRVADPDGWASECVTCVAVRYASRVDGTNKLGACAQQRQPNRS